MRGHERIQVTEPGRGAETIGSPIESPEVQEALMLLAYRDELKKKGNESESNEITIADPEKNTLEIQSAAGAFWVEPSLHGGDSFASSFRAYAEAHPYKRVHTGDEGELEDLITELAPDEQRKIS
jgi:hypothetical protein